MNGADGGIVTDSEGVPRAHNSFVQSVDHVEHFPFAEAHVTAAGLVVIEMRPVNCQFRTIIKRGGGGLNNGRPLDGEINYLT